MVGRRARSLATALLSVTLGTCLALMAACGDGGTPPDDDTMAKAPTNSGDGQTGPAGQALANQLRVLVTDADGDPLPDATVTWSTTDGSVAPTSEATDADGISATTWTLGPTEGSQTAQATLAGATGSPVNFTATATTAGITIAPAPTNSGDGQTGPVGQALANQLRVLVTDGDGEPVADVTVTWSTSDGSVAPTSAPTGADGISATTWTLGPTDGAQTADATLTGATGSPVTFTATATGANVCESLTPYTVGSTVEGTLSSTDCDFGDGSFIDFYSGSVDAAASVSFTLTAGFDTFLFLFDLDGNRLALNDDASDVTTNSTVRVLLATGSYVVGANSLEPGITGTYALTSETVAPGVTNCDEIWVTKGITTGQTLAEDDCAQGVVLSDEFLLTLQAGESVTLTQSSSAFDPSLTLLDNAGVTVGSDVGTTSEPAVVSFTASAAGTYTIIASDQTSDPFTTGAYTLTVE